MYWNTNYSSWSITPTALNNTETHIIIITNWYLLGDVVSWVVVGKVLLQQPLNLAFQLGAQLSVGQRGGNVPHLRTLAQEDHLHTMHSEVRRWGHVTRI